MVYPAALFFHHVHHAIPPAWDRSLLLPYLLGLIITYSQLPSYRVIFCVYPCSEIRQMEFTGCMHIFRTQLQSNPADLSHFTEF